MNTTSTLPGAALADLESGLKMLDLPLDLAGPLSDYLRLLLHWNRAYNLTAIRDPQQMVSRHLLDSLTLLPYIHQQSLADLGSGAGLPGIPLALARPQLQVTLVESNGKKARFLREVARQLALNNVEIVHLRIEAFARAAHYPHITARALASLADIVQAGGHLLAPKGQFLAMKGVYPSKEISALPKGWQLKAAHRLQVPHLVADERHLLVIERA